MSNLSAVDPGHTPERRKRSLSWSRPAAVLALVSLIVSMAGAWIPSIWTDEGATISASTRSLPALWHLLGNLDAVHGAYYVVMHFWFQIVPVTEITLRLPSALAVAATAYLLYLLARRFSATAATATVVIFVVLPRVTWMGAEGRSSAFSTLAAVAATWLLVAWLRRRRPRTLVAYALVALVGIYLHMYLVFLVAAHAVAVFALGRGRQRLVWLGTAAAVGALSLPLILIARGQSGQIAGVDRSPATWLRQVLVNQTFLGETPLQDGWWQPAAVGLAALGWGLALWGCWRARRESPALLWVAVPWLVLPSALIVAWSLIGQDLYHPRYFAFSVPALALLSGFGVSRLPGRAIGIAALAAVVALSAPIVVSQRGPTAKSGYDWAQVATFVGTHAKPGAAVYFAPTPPTRTIAISYPAPFTGLTDLTLRTSPSDHGSLAGDGRPLAEVVDGAPPVIWAIWRTDYVDRDRDISTLRAAGYSPTESWRGPRTEVIGFRR